MKGVVTLELKSMFDDASVQITAYILKTVTAALPSLAFASESRMLFRDLQLSDPTFYKRGHIEALIGADAYGRIIEPHIVKPASSRLIAQKTTLGWIVSGPLDGKPQQPRTHSATVGNSENEQLAELLTKFWVQEEVPGGPELKMSHDELECENHFKATHSRDETGRYIVRLPFKGDRTAIHSLGETLPAALRCLRRVTRRLETDAAYRTLYTEFLKEYEQMGHMERVNETSERNPTVYLPHLGVLREDHVTTKLRVVFNGSSRSSTGLSINQILHAGGKLQTDAPDVLLSLRRHRWAFGTDIVKMFRQIKVHPDDWDLQRIVWVDESGKLISFRLTTVTYGLTCAPWLALRTLQQLAEDEGHRFPLAVPCITKSRYVDDIFGGSESRNELQAIITDLIGLCNAGGFFLQKWSSNCPQILKDMGLQPSENHTVPLDDSAVSVLGMCWHPLSDTLRYKPKAFNASTFTKRSLLSEISQVYDPLGLVSPVVIRAKVLIQELWLLKVGWDDPLPPSYVENWRSFRTELTQLEELTIPRWLQVPSGSPNLQLHGFSDASMTAMSAVVYLRTEHQGRASTVSIMCAKTRVAPIKRMTIPRLELTAALMLSQLMNYAQRMLEVETLQLYLWTDSSVALAWIKSSPSRWKEFVRNRVAKIQTDLPQGEWRHINGKENPADCASRGVTTSELLSHPLWWAGPEWLRLPPSQWPTSTLGLPSEASVEAKAVQSCVATATDRQHSQPWDLLGKYSRLSKLLQVTASVQRAIQRLRRRRNYPSPVLDPQEIEDARLYWLKDTQQQFFGSVLRMLASSTVPSNHPLSRLTPFVDQDGVLRIGGRLKFSELSPEEKQPAIKPRHAPLTTLLIDEAHEQTLHGGNQLTLAYLRQRYWIIGGRASVRSRLLKCVICARQRGERAQQLMAQLPATRVTPSRPFLHTGVDYAGPITVKTWRGRAAKTYKGYIAVFVCFSTSAVHLELVTDYSSDAFVAAYKRFTGRRGVCETIMSDRGTTLVGADKQLRRLFNQASTDYQHLAASIASLGTRWIFNPPAAPHFGGKWEAAVKSVKYHLKRIIGDSTWTYEEFTTLLVQIEAILNSRPLCPLSDDPDDLAALTPGHFLIGEPLTTVPEPRYDTDNVSRLSRRQHIQSRIQLFWERWSAECLQRYQAISKWKHPSTQIKVGSMVLLTDERLPPSRWALARVTQLHPGADGLTRVVDLRTSTTTLTRPVTKLCILPIDTQDTSLTGQ